MTTNGAAPKPDGTVGQVGRGRRTGQLRREMRAVYPFGIKGETVVPFSPLEEFDIMIPNLRETFCEVPFVIDRNLKVSLVDQVAEGLRQAISAGRYKRGDVLPPVWKLAEVLGVSVRVPRYAIAKLVSEGYLASRQRIGAVVLGRDEMVWRGRVLFIVYAHNESHILPLVAPISS